MAEENDSKHNESESDETEADAKKPSSPWPSARPGPVVASASSTQQASAADAPLARAPWAAPLFRLDAAWTRVDARLCAGVFLAEVLALVFWIAMKSMSMSGNAGPGRVFRALVTAVTFGLLTHWYARKRPHAQIIVAVESAFGLALGLYWGDLGATYFANVLAWLQNASILVFFGGVSDLAKRLTLWLALLGASVATAQGKHINVDVVMRFLGPKARVPVAVLGWVAAAVVCLAGVWGFFDHVAVEDYHAATSIPCPGDASKRCPASPGSKVDTVVHHSFQDLFLARKQITLDLRTLPKVLAGTPYGKTLTGAEWNAWLKGGGWENHFAAEDVKALELSSEQESEFRTPAVTAVPGASERVDKLLVRELNLVFAFGLLVIGIRFLIRAVLALAGWIKVDPDAAHGDEDLHAHGPLPVPGTVPAEVTR